MSGDERQAFYPGRAPIDAYGNGGFRFAEMSHRGSILCLASGVSAWPVASTVALRPDDFAPVFAPDAGVSVLLLGTGDVQVFPDSDIRRIFIDRGIALEAMDTGAACRTYNVLLAEGRPVGAALIAVGDSIQGRERR